MGVLCPSFCFCRTDGRSERMKASILSGMRPHMGAISVAHSGGVLAGTGFLIDRNLLVTTHAVLPSSSTAMNANVRLHGALSAHLCPQRFFITSSILDLTVVFLLTPIAKSDWLHCSKAGLKSSLNFGSKVFFLGHRGRELIIGEGKVVIATDNLVKLSTDHASWSAGSAGFDHHGNLSFMICDPMKRATSSNTSSSSSSKDEFTHFGIPITIIRDWLNSHWSGDLTKRMRSLSLDHSCASFPLGRLRQEEAERSSLIERRAENDGPVRILNVNFPPAERDMEESDDDRSPSPAEVSSTGSVNGGIGRNEIECSPSVSAVRNQWSSEEETMYSAETAESRNYSTPPRYSKFPPVGCSSFSKTSPGIGSRGSGRVFVGKHVKQGNLPGGAPQKSNDYFTPTVASVMKKRNGSNQAGQPRWMP